MWLKIHREGRRFAVSPIPLLTPLMIRVGDLFHLATKYSRIAAERLYETFPDDLSYPYRSENEMLPGQRHFLHPLESPHCQSFLRRMSRDLHEQIIGPGKPERLRALWSDLEEAAPDVRARALGYLEGLLRAG